MLSGALWAVRGPVQHSEFCSTSEQPQLSEGAKKKNQGTPENSNSNYTLASICQLHHHQQEESHRNVTERVTFKMFLRLKEGEKSPNVAVAACSSISMSSVSSSPQLPAPLLCGGSSGWHQLLERPHWGPGSATSSRLAPCPIHIPGAECPGKTQPSQQHHPTRTFHAGNTSQTQICIWAACVKEIPVFVL